MAFWNIFQSTYDRIKGWEWSPEMAEAIQAINDRLPKVIADAILGYIKIQYERSEDIARASLKSIKDILGDIID